MLSKRLYVVLPLAGMIAGCGPKPYDREHPAVAPSANPTTAIRLVDVAKEHPAPHAVINLDKAESDAAAHPDDLSAQRTLAFCYYRLEAYAQAVPAFEKVVKLTPNDPSALQFLGYAQMAAGDIDGALTTFTALTETKAISPAVLSDAYVEMGTCDWAQQRDDQAAEAFSRSLTSNPHQGQASLGIGIYDAAKGKREEARAAFQNAARDLQPGPRRAQAFSCLGRLAEDGNDTAAALAAYKQALALNPDNAWAKRAVSRLQAKPKRS